MIKVYTNQPITLKAKLDDPEPKKLVELKSLGIFNTRGELIKSINAEKSDDEWSTAFVFGKDSLPGNYEIKWEFVFNGDPFYKVDYLELRNEAELTTSISEVKNKKEVVDDTLPDDIKALLP